MAAFISLSSSSALGHFIWVRLVPGEGDGLSARASFAESPEPDREGLLEKISSASFHIRGTDGKRQHLKLSKTGEGDHAELVTAVPARGACSLEATCDYGVYELHDRPLLLQYYARAVAAKTPAEVGSLGPATELALDIVPKCESGQLKAVVLWRGKPQPGLAVQVISPNKKRQKLTTDAEGAVTLPAGSGGKFALQTSFTEANRSGERDGRKYVAVGHYATLTIDVPPTQSAAKGANLPQNAQDVLARARHARAVWEKFPGFTANVVIQVEQRSAAGKLTVSSDGQIDLELGELPQDDLKWARQHLRSLVQHQMPDGSLGDGASIVPEEGSHPLGPRIRLAEEVMGSEYRIKDDVVTQVNRLMGKQRLTINVLDVFRNAEGRYLPSVFTVTSSDVASGSLISTQTVLHSWVRVGQFDLPSRILEVDCRSGGNQVRAVQLSGHRLAE